MLPGPGPVSAQPREDMATVALPGCVAGCAGGRMICGHSPKFQCAKLPRACRQVKNATHPAGAICADIFVAGGCAAGFWAKGAGSKKKVYDRCRKPLNFWLPGCNPVHNGSPACPNKMVVNLTCCGNY